MKIIDQEFTAADLYCGGGGTSTGLVQAAIKLNKRVSLTAINHWDVAIETHNKNHPSARHLCSSVDNLDPRKLFPSGRLNLLVASPECTHHSNARGGRPCSDQSRSGAWEIVRWANALYIDNILIENVPEFESWGPLSLAGTPMLSKKGETFQAFKGALSSLGYRVDHRIINSADYGDPQERNRFFLIARRGNKKIRWPEPTHTEAGGKNLFGITRPWVPAREIIDWSIPGQSIFNRKKPLAEKTLARIEYGLRKFGGADFLVKFFGTGKGVSLDRPMDTITATGQHLGLCEPFVLPQQAGGKNQLRVRSINKPLSTITTTGAECLIEPFLIDRNSSHAGDTRVRSLDRPAQTLTTRPGLALVEPYLVGIDHKSAGESLVRSINRPHPTIITQQNYALVQAYILKYNGTAFAKSLDEPLDTVTTKDRFALVELFRRHPDLDIRLRMLQPHELAAAQSFPPDYKFAGNKGQIVKQIGNAVPVRTAEALCRELIK